MGLEARITLSRRSGSPLPANYFDYTGTAPGYFVDILKSDVLLSSSRQPSPEVFQSLLKGKKPAEGRAAVAYEMLQGLDDLVLYQDPDLLIINKPAGIPTHGNDKEDLGVEEIVKYRKGMHVQLAHRLDSYTTGVLVLVNNFETLVGMSQQFSDKEGSNMRKEYLALLDGEFTSAAEREVCVKIGPTGGKSLGDSKTMRVIRPGEPVDRKNSRDTHTFFKPLILLQSETDPPRNMTLAAVRLMTGRKHQIRVVAAQALGMPIVGDVAYNHNKTGAPRPMLHAHGLSFTHPRTGEQMDILAPVPDDFRQVTGSLKAVKRY